MPTFVIDEYVRNDAERAVASSGQYPVVYDCIENSPYYSESQPDHPYIDEREAIELPPVSEQTEGLVNEPYQKKYFFNPYNPPYTLEKPISIQSSSGGATGPGESKLYDKRGVPKINRYFERLKPFYKLSASDPTSDKTLIFESRFESGNLKRAVKV